LTCTVNLGCDTLKVCPTDTSNIYSMPKQLAWHEKAKPMAAHNAHLINNEDKYKNVKF